MLLFNQKVIKFSVIIIAFLLFSGCAFIQDPLGQKKIEQLRQKAESIFKRQNIASSQVMILTMDEENTILSDAELAMQEACAKLNAYVIRSMSSDNFSMVDFLAQQQVIRSLDNCDAATKKLEALLPPPFTIDN
ncbi:hypothetical protein [methanotrophic endosymbiont of Bathymodiolus puteoserpentis (Logatchev)]|jgi:hypothetical protein|uniref:hypothetical protein n=1 Tax=methanotrophic endosymbiont of Bathymodiolus puteoserpentis (Logatchev) TaxID=343235 RepID=UPI0013CD800B|nr:hypothetical protein [methanotrophic endosymbiont of Bathymodiolus puteoserpentis (Logatchev)]SHE21577.1 hypothetical protein BPUTEOMOX_1130 [methanotrophic endosymbiont of Bathymodiolus puteoserpentis (Logatchev)]